MARYKSKAKNGTLFITLLMISFAMLFLPQSITKNLNFFYIELFKPLLSLGKEGPAQPFLSGDVSQDFVSRTEYDSLWKAYKNIKAELHQLEDEYEILANYRLVMPLPGPALLPASIITHQPSDYMIIDRGSNDGVEIGQYVLGGNTIIGEILETSPATSRVALVTRKDNIMQVRVQRDGSRKYFTANMIGTGLGNCKIKLLPTHDNIKEGDSIYAAPRPGVLGGAIIVGEASIVWPAKDNPLLWDITVRPIVSPKEIADVAVILMDPKEDTNAMD